MSIFDIDKNIESIDENIQEHKRKQIKHNQLKPDQYIKIVNVINDLKYINASYNGEMVYVVGSDELYMYAGKWIKIQASYEPI